jgi:APA family basic amino acid/polyamine antiporter
MIAFFSVNMSLIVLRMKKPDEQRPFKIGLNLPFRGAKIPVSAILGALATLAVWILIVITKPYGRYLGVSWMIFGCGLFFLYRRKRNLPIKGSLAVHKVKVEKRVLPPIRHILVPIQSMGDTEVIYSAAEIAKSHNASLTILHIIEVPNTLPLDSELRDQLAEATTLMRYAEAIVRETDVLISHSILRGRAFSEVLAAALKEKKWELIVVAGRYWDRKTSQAIGNLLDQRLFQVWICY